MPQQDRDRRPRALLLSVFALWVAAVAQTSALAQTPFKLASTPLESEAPERPFYCPAYLVADSNYSRPPPMPPLDGETPIPADLLPPLISDEPEPFDPLPFEESEPTRREPGADRLTYAIGGNLPNVLSDSPFGASLAVGSQQLQTSFAHPSFNTRLNVAENNSPLPRNRVFYTYRHFEDPTRANFFGQASQSDVDQHLFGSEVALFDGLMSFEARLPFQSQLGSDLPLDFVPAEQLNSLSPRSREFELGNLGLTWKMLLAQRETFALSGGLSVLLPTAQSVRLQGRLDNSSAATADDFLPLSGIAGVPFAKLQSNIDATFHNDTVELTPFLGLAYTPQSPFFAQGFLQFGVPLNPSRAQIAFSPLVDANGNPAPDVTLQGFARDPNNPQAFVQVGNNATIRNRQLNLNLLHQTLLRINSQVGYWLYRDEIKSLAGVLEFHYTSTLNPSRTSSATFATLNGQNIDFTANNPLGQLAFVTAGAGLAGNYGLTQFQVGGLVPLERSQIKPFDFEIHAAINRRF